MFTEFKYQPSIINMSQSMKRVSWGDKVLRVAEGVQKELQEDAQADEGVIDRQASASTSTVSHTLLFHFTTVL